MEYLCYTSKLKKIVVFNHILELYVPTVLTLFKTNFSEGKRLVNKNVGHC